VQVNRSGVISLLTKKFGGVDFVLAAWLEGADAHDRADSYSDIDLWLDVEDGREEEALALVRDALSTIAPLDLALEVAHPHPLIRQAFFRPAGFPESLLIDVCVQGHSRNFTFRRGMQDGNVAVLFDRAGVIRFEDLDQEAFRKELLFRLADLEAKLELSPVRVRKELRRGRFLEAFGAYHDLVLEPLVEALRLLYSPTKFSFGLKHVGADVPADVVERLEDLHIVANGEDIERKMATALELLGDTLNCVGRSLAARQPRQMSSME
jgi:hypothetical protein